MSQPKGKSKSEDQELTSTKKKSARRVKAKVINDSPKPTPKEAPPVSQVKPKLRVPGKNHKTSSY